MIYAFDTNSLKQYLLTKNNYWNHKFTPFRDFLFPLYSNSQNWSNKKHDLKPEKGVGKNSTKLKRVRLPTPAWLQRFGEPLEPGDIANKVRISR